MIVISKDRDSSRRISWIKFIGLPLLQRTLSMKEKHGDAKDRQLMRYYIEYCDVPWTDSLLLHIHTYMYVMRNSKTQCTKIVSFTIAIGLSMSNSRCYYFFQDVFSLQDICTCIYIIYIYYIYIYIYTHTHIYLFFLHHLWKAREFIAFVV